ncbi:hypothetical protein Isop_0998 [Isosphaera pallida ATCC 43644]|uniref:Uncharacterized protein n=1 Tax=Isosphaera pallida (strain ATCC 43644 / DSM 9630 / IS1B) TaxID=575540 RepID=E8R3M0_ISOPI|nr:hypothetical protein [Isosphaera pallida]ADV61587.1 hypothetical protein Isop_0998 [Isosphaera pallida ATCC 43644]
MVGKRGGGSGGGTSSGRSGGEGRDGSPWLVLVAILMGVGLAFWTLVRRETISWPPRELVSGGFVMSCGLALVGPIVLGARAREVEGSGERLWLSGGLFLWAHDLAALIRGDWRLEAWITPLAPTTLGMFAAAVLAAGFKSRRGRPWEWTNVVGWTLGLGWIALAAWSSWSSLSR